MCLGCSQVTDKLDVFVLDFQGKRELLNDGKMKVTFDSFEKAGSRATNCC